MTKIKIQHYVPRFYLENFSRSDGKNNILECFDKLKEKQFNTDIKNVACEKFFYDKEDDSEQKIEKLLADQESKYCKSLLNLIKIKDPIQLSNEDRYIIGLFIAVQYIRSKEQRESLKDMINQLSERLSKEKLVKPLEEQLKKAKTAESIKSLHIDLLSLTPKIADIIFKMKWILMLNKTKTPFWTSDNPIALHNEMDHWPYGNLGLACLGIELHFPLTPRLLLVTCDPISFYTEPSKKQLRDFRYIIREQNYQVNWATRFIFSNSPNFSFAKKVIKENPRHKDSSRRRVVID